MHKKLKGLFPLILLLVASHAGYAQGAGGKGGLSDAQAQTAITSYLKTRLTITHEVTTMVVCSRSTTLAPLMTKEFVAKLTSEGLVKGVELVCTDPWPRLNLLSVKAVGDSLELLAKYRYTEDTCLRQHERAMFSASRDRWVLQSTAFRVGYFNPECN